MIIVTGGAGFIGSALIWGLNGRGRTDIILVDDVDHDQKEANIGHLQYEEQVSIADFRERLQSGEYDSMEIEGILHMGACSDTTETNWDYLEDNNVEYSKDIIRWCFDKGVRCVYASSAATYGDGSQGYNDDPDLFNELEPLNLYGKSKLLIDIWARDGGYLEKVAGVRYFNVFGPNEFHKGDMRSVIAKKYPDMMAGKPIQLFASKNPKYADGEQMRDFIYIKDVIAITLWLFDHPEANGVFNVGTGKARSWNDVVNAMAKAAGVEPNIEYIPMPPALKGKYQDFTQADMERLKEAGFTGAPTTLEEAINDYISHYLSQNKHLGE